MRGGTWKIACVKSQFNIIRIAGLQQIFEISHRWDLKSHKPKQKHWRPVGNIYNRYLISYCFSHGRVTNVGSCNCVINCHVISRGPSQYNLFYQYRDSHVKDKMVSPTILSLTWEPPYLEKMVFILKHGPERKQSERDRKSMCEPLRVKILSSFMTLFCRVRTTK